MDLHIDRFWRMARLQGLIVLAALSLAACATPRYEVGRPMIGAHNGAPQPSDTKGQNGKALRGTEKPYQINGVWYYPKADRDYNAVGTGSWYGEQFHNRRTANGEIFDMDIPSAAHKTLPLPSLVEVTNLDNGRRMIVRVNDRGPFVGDRIIDLSKAAAEELGYRRQGVAKVRVKYIGPAPKSVFDAPRQYAQVPAKVEAPTRSFDDIREPTQRVQVLAPRGEPEPSTPPVPAINPPAPASAAPKTGEHVMQADAKALPEKTEKTVQQPVLAMNAPPINPPDPVSPAAKADDRAPVRASVAPEKAEKPVEQAAAAARVEPPSAPPASSANPPASVAASPASKSGYRIQAGAFASRERAEKAVEKLASAGGARIEPVERRSGTLYRVVVTAGDTEGEARSLRQRVEALGYSGATVLRP